MRHNDMAFIYISFLGFSNIMVDFFKKFINFKIINKNLYIIRNLIYHDNRLKVIIFSIEDMFMI